MARGQEALNLGLLGQDACVLPRRPRPLLQCSPGLPVRAGQAGPHQAGIERLHTCGLAALCRAGMPGSVSASAAVSVLSRSPLL